MTNSKFCEKQFFNDATLIVEKPSFWPKIQNLVNFVFKQYLDYQCLFFISVDAMLSVFITFYSTISTPKLAESLKVATFEKKR